MTTRDPEATREKILSRSLSGSSSRSMVLAAIIVSMTCSSDSTQQGSQESAADEAFRQAADGALEIRRNGPTRWHGQLSCVIGISDPGIPPTGSFTEMVTDYPGW